MFRDMGSVTLPIEASLRDSALAQIRDAMQRGEYVAWLAHSTVERDFRRQGVARRIMETIIAWAPQADIVRLVLHASDEGRPLYASIGFEPTNEMRYARPL